MIIFIYGADTFRAKKKLNELKEKFKKDIDREGTSIKHLDGEKTSLDELGQALGASSLFSSKRLIVVENISKNKSSEINKSLRDYLKKTEESENKNDNIVIFIDESNGEKMGRNVLWKFLLAQKFVQKFEPLNITQTNAWVKKRASELGANLSLNQCNKISGLYGSDLWLIESELKKIINYKRGQHGTLIEEGVIQIADQDLESLSRGKTDENIFALTDAIAARNKKEALAILEQEIDAGMAETYLLHMIVRQFRIMLQIKQAQDQGLGQRKMASDLGLHPFVVQKSLKYSSAYSLEFLKKLFSNLVNIDKDMKSGKADFLVAMDLLIAKL